MHREDLRSMPEGARVDADVCVVGSGPAGASIAAELARGSIRVCLLEGGGTKPEPSTQALYAFESVGHPWGRGELVRRVRVLGGTSTVWTGRCAPFDPIDFVERAWIPHSGWPIARHDLEGHLERAAILLGLGPQRYDDSVWARFGVPSPRPPLDPSLLRTQLWQHSRGSQGRATDFSRDVLETLEDARDLTLIMHANVTRIATRDGGAAVTGVEASTLEGKRLTVRAPIVVLACGAIENARVLLASNDARPAGLGNEHDIVGRFLMDHLNPEIGRFDPVHAPALLERFGHFWLDDARGRHVFSAGVALSERVMRTRELPGCTASILADSREDDALLALRRAWGSLRGRRDARAIARDLVCAGGQPLELVRAALRRAAHRPEIPSVRALRLATMIEQIPDPESRVALSSARDALGVPIVRVDWRVHRPELDAAVVILELLERELPRLGLPAPRRAPWVVGEADWRDSVDDIAHPMGTTRMARDPRRGVVDERCAVHGVDGLYVAGGSVFPTAGTANPTLMIVALALRLAGEIRARVGRSDASVIASGPARSARLHVGSGAPVIGSGLGQRATLRVTAPSARLRIGIVGAGDRATGTYRPVLSALGDRVELVGVVTRSRDRAAAFDVPAFESAEALARDAQPQLLVSCVADRANAAVLASLLPLGIPVLAETPLAWSLREARTLARRIESSGALVGVAENWPYLPMEELKSALREAGVLGRVLAAHDDRAGFRYHSVAQLRRYLGLDRAPIEASATRSECVLASGEGAETWQTGSVRYDDGATLHVQHGAGAALTRIPGALRIHGELASMDADELRTADGALARARREHGERGVLRRVAIEVPGIGVVAWDNPYAEHALTDDQIAVARHLDAMRRAVLGEGEPLYTPADALIDLEIVRALEVSAALSGVPVPIPIGVTGLGVRLARFRLSSSSGVR